MSGDGSSNGSSGNTLSWRGDRPRRGHICDNCGKDFSSVHQLAQHTRIHSGEKPYKCSFCDRTFKQLSHVQQHTRLHTGERPYKCPSETCGKSFIQLSNLNQHMKTHRNIDLKVASSNNVCPICTRCFKTDSSLVTHKCRGRLKSMASQETDDSVDSASTAASLAAVNSIVQQHPVIHVPVSMPSTFFDTRNGHSSSSGHSIAEIKLESSHGRHSSSEDEHFRKRNQLPPSFWSCPICKFNFSSKVGFAAHLEEMRMDPRHQIEAQLFLHSAMARNDVRLDDSNLKPW